MIETLASQPWVARLGWTLLHFLWQGAAVALLYAVVRHRLAGADARYRLACGALALLITAPLLTWTVIAPPQAGTVETYRIHGATPQPADAAAAVYLPAELSGVVSRVAPARFLPWVVIVWIAGAAAFWTRLAGGWLIAARMRSMLVRRAPPEWQSVLCRLGEQIGLSRSVRLMISALVQVPTVVGWLRPVILMPVGALAGLPVDHLEVLLLHELAHIRRHDYLVNLLQGIAEALLFYHPAVWWISGHIRAERELCCDDVAVSVTGDVLTYARALAQLESYRPAHLTAALAANGGSLSGRISRLLGEPRPSGGWGSAAAAVAMFLWVAVYGVLAQSAEPAFPAASIKPHPASERRSMIVRVEAGGRLHTQDAAVKLLIQNAYRIQSFQIVGGPAWIQSDGFDIEAKPETASDEKQVWVMLRSLLADRFRLQVHRETREFPVWALTAAAGGLKLPPSKGGDCIHPDASAPAPARGAPPGIPCGSIRVGMAPAGMRRLAGQLVSMAELVRILSMVLDKPVLNQTGFTGDLDVQLDFAPDDTTLGLVFPGMAPPPPADSNQPNIQDALHQQLGLKIAPSKGPVEVLVIDHVERPTAN